MLNLATIVNMTGHREHGRQQAGRAWVPHARALDLPGEHSKDPRNFTSWHRASLGGACSQPSPGPQALPTVRTCPRESQSRWAECRAPTTCIPRPADGRHADQHVTGPSPLSVAHACPGPQWGKHTWTFKCAVAVTTEHCPDPRQLSTGGDKPADPVHTHSHTPRHSPVACALWRLPPSQLSTRAERVLTALRGSSARCAFCEPPSVPCCVFRKCALSYGKKERTEGHVRRWRLPGR